MERRVVHYSGRVQGVGFRATVRQIARGIKVSGFVRNLYDGRVELVVEGDAVEISQLLAEVSRVMRDNIDDVEHKSLPATGEFENFQIR